MIRVRPNGQSYKPKVGVTDRKSELQLGTPLESEPKGSTDPLKSLREKGKAQKKEIVARKKARKETKRRRVGGSGICLFHCNKPMVSY